jgi:hypothetical protein
MASDNAQATLEAAQAWIEAQLPLVTPTKEQALALRSLIGGQGLGTLLGLMHGSRQTYFVQLSNCKLGTPEGVAQAAVLQGAIKGIDLLRDTLLEQVTPDEASKEQNP